jgi:hypothetical protein
MPTRGKVIRIAGILIVGILAISTAVRSQAPTDNIWEYASVSGSPRNTAWSTGVGGRSATVRATICYATLQGCRFEELSATIMASNQATDALMMASARLGNQGWEFITATELPSSSAERVMYFRRLKAK